MGEGEGGYRGLLCARTVREIPDLTDTFGGLRFAVLATRAWANV